MNIKKRPLRKPKVVRSRKQAAKKKQPDLPSPQAGASKYRLQDLIDIEQFQALQDRLNEIYSFPSAITDNKGNILTATAWQDVCTKFHRTNKKCEKECIKSDQYCRTDSRRDRRQQ
jgi:hypothetical protein